LIDWLDPRNIMKKVSVNIVASDFLEVILPAIQEEKIWCDDEYLQFAGHVVQVEGLKIEGLTDGQDPLRGLDFAGIDYLYSHRGVKGLAVRVQTDSKNWRTFTLRTWTPNGGSNVEWKKKMIAYNNDSLLPYLTLQAYIKEDSEVIGIGIVKTKDLLKYCLDGGKVKDQTNRQDGTKFKAISWDDLRQAGLKVYEI